MRTYICENCGETVYGKLKTCTVCGSENLYEIKSFDLFVELSELTKPINLN